LKYIEDALEQIPEAHHYTRGITDTFWAVAGQMQGQKEMVVAKLTDLLHNQPLTDVRKIRVMAALVFVYIVAGELAFAFSLSRQLKNFAISINSNHYSAWSSYFLGLIHFCRNELDMAIDHLSQTTELGYIILRRATVDCLGGLALAYQAKQQTDKATASIKRLNEYIRSIDDPALLDISHSFAARLSLMKGKKPIASGLSSRKGRSNAEPMFLWLDLPDITQCRVLLAAGSDTDLQEAENKLKACLRLSQAHHNTFQRINIMPLLASVYEKQGRFEEALTVLEEAVNLAGPSGSIRPFVESGPAMVSLLKRLADKNIAVDYIGHLLDAISPPTHQPSSIARTSDGQLTNREHDILELVAQRLQTKEIAEKLFISTHTVNAHLKNIYRKLDVHNRQEAIAIAKNLDIL
jgi:LuxR family maltose regulon positive regulatory protein